MKPEKNRKPLEDRDLEQVHAGTEEDRHYPLPEGTVITARRPEWSIDAEPKPLYPEYEKKD